MDSLMEMKNKHGFTPKALLNRVPLRIDCLKYKQAFYFLSGQREYSQVGPHAIPVSEITAYLKAKRIDDEDEIDTYMEAIVAMDGVYREHVHKQMERASKT